MTSKLQKKPSALKRGHPALINMKFLNFFLLLWAIFVLLDPDPIQIRIPDFISIKITQLFSFPLLWVENKIFYTADRWGETTDARCADQRAGILGQADQQHGAHAPT
jgi:hypothetical protein